MLAVRRSLALNSRLKGVVCINANGLVDWRRCRGLTTSTGGNDQVSWEWVPPKTKKDDEGELHVTEDPTDVMHGNDSVKEEYKFDVHEELARRKMKRVAEWDPLWEPLLDRETMTVKVKKHELLTPMELEALLAANGCHNVIMTKIDPARNYPWNYIILASAQSTSHLEKIGTMVKKAYKARRLKMRRSVRHQFKFGWVCLDYKDICVNIMTQSVRERYKLEARWLENGDNDTLLLDLVKEAKAEEAAFIPQQSIQDSHIPLAVRMARRENEN